MVRIESVAPTPHAVMTREGVGVLYPLVMLRRVLFGRLGSAQPVQHV